MAALSAFAFSLMLEYAANGADMIAEPMEEAMWIKRKPRNPQDAAEGQKRRRPYTFADVKPEQQREVFDSAGLSIGLTTGVPISPTHGISSESLIGASIHNSYTPAPDTSCHVDTTTHVDASASIPCDTGGSTPTDTSGTGGF